MCRLTGLWKLNWPPPGFTIANATSLLNGLWRRRDGLKCCDYEGQQQRVTGTRPSHLFPTLAADHPQRKGWTEPFAFLWNALRPLDPSVGILSDRKDLLPGWLKPAPWMTSQQSGVVGAPDLVAAAPDPPPVPAAALPHTSLCVGQSRSWHLRSQYHACLQRVQLRWPGLAHLAA